MYDLNLNNIMYSDIIKLSIKYSTHAKYRVDTPFALVNEDDLYFTPLRNLYSSVIEQKYCSPF